MGIQSEIDNWPGNWRGNKGPDGWREGQGDTVGLGVQGWSKAARFFKTNASHPGEKYWRNHGTVETAVWVPELLGQAFYDSLGKEIDIQYENFGPQKYTYTETKASTGAQSFEGNNKVLSTAATDNDDIYIHTDGGPIDIVVPTSSEVFDWDFEVRVLPSDTGGGEGNFVAGLVRASDVAADFLGDNGGGPPSNYEGALFWKADGDTVWNWEYSRQGTQYETQEVGDFTSAAWTTLRMIYSNGILTPYLDGVAGTPHTVIIAPSDYFRVLLGVKAGTGTLTKLSTDYWKVLMNYTTGRFGG
jgi:hypothetical protein